MTEQPTRTTSVTDWLLSGPPWVEYRTRVDLLGQPEDAPDVTAARRAMVQDHQVAALIIELGQWPGPVLKSHKSAGHLLHRLVFLADLGLRSTDPGMTEVVARVQSHQSPEGPYQVLVNISPKYGGSGEDQFAWMLCDAPLLLYALSKFGLADPAPLDSAIDSLVALERENGWPCAVSPILGKFRGPGRKADPCPYANLVMLKLLALLPERRDSQSAQRGVEALLSLWAAREERRPYLFAMGSGFRKLKAPFVWYDILNVADVLTRFPWALGDSRLLEMVEVIRPKADADGRFKAESVWRAWKDWDFGQKREPSRWVTLLANRALNRVDAAVAKVV